MCLVQLVAQLACTHAQAQDLILGWEGQAERLLPDLQAMRLVLPD